MREVIRLTQAIRAFLTGAPGGPPAEALAVQYGQWRQEAANRLEACAAMLEKGNEYQVLQLAESEPPLLDLVAELSFAEEPQWVSYCHQQQLGTPARLDGRTIQTLNAIYDKGISHNSPLYKDYRTAVTSRDDEKAWQIIRTIVRLNPSDTNARTELERMQNKHLLALLDKLKTALAKGDKDGVAALVEEMDVLATPEKLARHDVYQEGAAVRKAVLTARGEAESAEQLESAEHKRAAGDWKAVSACAARVRLLEKERELTLPADQLARLAQLETYVRQQRLEANEQSEFDQALKSLASFADSVDTRLLTGATLTLDEAQNLEVSFVEKWRHVEKFHRPIQQAELARLQGSGLAIRRESNRLRGTRKARRFLMAAAATTLALGAAWTGYVAWRAHGYVQQLDSFHERHLAAAAAKLVEEIPANAPFGAASIPSLRAKMEELRQWSHSEQEHQRLTETLLSELEKASAEKFKDIGPKELRDKLAAAKDYVNRLASDLGGAGRDRLDQLENKIDQHLVLLREQHLTDLQGRLTKLQTLTAELSFEKSSAELKSKLAALEPELKEMEKSLTDENPELRPPADEEAAIKMIRQQASPFLTEASDLAKALQEMKDADNLDAYAKALSGYSKLKLTEAGESAPILADLPKPDSLAAKLLFHGDAAAWEVLKKDTSMGSTFRPTDVLEGELKILLRLRDDPLLNEIWEVEVTKEAGKGSRKVWSVGQPTESSTGSFKHWRSNIYDPEKSANIATFQDTRYTPFELKDGSTRGDTVTKFKESATKKFLESLHLNRVTDANGEHHQIALLGLMDTIIRAPGVSPLAKAYVMDRLHDIVKLRPYLWGLQYCPSLAEDHKAFTAIVGEDTLRSDDWMVPDIQSRHEAKLKQFFQTTAAHPPYLNEAFSYRNLAVSVRDAGVNYVGFIDGERQPHVKGKGVSASELWAAAERGTLPARVTFSEGKPNADSFRAAKKWSPLFLIPIDRGAALAKLRADATGSTKSDGAAPYEPLVPSPFLEQP